MLDWLNFFPPVVMGVVVFIKKKCYDGNVDIIMARGKSEFVGTKN